MNMNASSCPSSTACFQKVSIETTAPSLPELPASAAWASTLNKSIILSPKSFLLMFEQLDERRGFEIVIPAKAGIHCWPLGFRLKAGMTEGRDLLESADGGLLFKVQ